MNLSLILELSCAYLCYPPLWMGLDLLSIFVLTQYIFLVLLHMKIQTLLLKTSSRGCVRTQCCLWCWPSARCFC